LVEGRKGARGGLTILHRSIYGSPDGSYTDEARRNLGDA